MKTTSNVRLSSHVAFRRPAYLLLALSLIALFATFHATLLHSAPPTTGIVTLVAPARGDQPHPMAVALVQPADYVCATLEISSSQKDATAQIAETRGTLALIKQAAEKSPVLTVHQGPMRFSTRFSTIFAPGLSNSPASFSKVNKNTAADIGQTTNIVRILCKLSADPDDIFNASKTLRDFIATIKPAGQSELLLLQMGLAVEAPERQRERLLQLIHESADAMRKTFLANHVTIDGLEGPVLVRQVNDSQVELYIDYKLSVTMEK